MKKMVVLMLIMLMLAGCAPKPEYDVRGSWQYTILDADGNFYDSGSITFSGEPGKGTWTQVNYYEYEYEGEFSVRGEKVSLTGDETWQGTLLDMNAMSGTCKLADGGTGSWSALRASP